MSYELIITEKPNAAKKIADSLAEGAPVKSAEKGVPYYRLERGGRDIVVGCAVGHLYTVAEKNKGKWTYPIFETEWVPSSKVSKASKFTSKYLNVLKKLSKDAGSFTIATDYDIEGEVIGLNVLRYACKQKDASRMKFSTLTKGDLIESYENKAKHIDWGQANAGLTRHEMDWVWGINISRALTLAIKKATEKFKLLSSGRVQGPALKIIVDREKEIAAFKAVPYWQIRLEGSADENTLEAWHKEDKFWDRGKAEQVMEIVRREKKAAVSKIEKKQYKQAPPFPFDLTSLQIEAHKTIHISPARTLEMAQALYIEGVISYPRTSSQKLPSKIGYSKILNLLAKQESFEKEVSILKRKKSLTPNEGKKTDEAHPAIYPTGYAPKTKDEKVLQLYELIARRFLATFGDNAVRETMNINIDVKGEIFIATGTRTVEKGWHELYGRFVMLSEEELPDVAEGQEIAVKKIEMLGKETQPPKRYTEASIIKEMEKKNLGTKSTRAQMIENLYSRGYVDGRPIQATGLGIKTVDVLLKYSPDILDEKMTRKFEEEMEDIRHDKKTPDSTMADVRKVLSEILEKFRKHELRIGKELSKAVIETRDELTTVGKCRVCGKGSLQIRKGKFGLFIACSGYPECKTTYSLPSAIVKPAKKECGECGFPMVMIIKKRKRPQEVCINPECPSKEAGKEMLEMAKQEKPCPRCKEGKIVVRKSLYGAFLGCSSYPKCRYIEQTGEKEEEESKNEKID